MGELEKEMKKQSINMVGGGFQHGISSSDNNTPQHMIWVKGNHTAPISIHINDAIFKKTDPTKRNFGWLHESKTIKPKMYADARTNVKELEKKFELVFMHDQDLASISDKFVWIKWKGNPWVIDKAIHPKSKLVSMFASSKIMCPAHVYRHEILQKFKDKVDHFGTGFKSVARKEEGLNDYFFNIAMENHTYRNSYSEKLTDCFATGTVPIYYGNPGIGEIWNTDGMIMLNNNFKIEDLSPELYYSMMPAIKDNFQRVMNMPVSEDYIYTEFIKKIL